MNFLAHYVIATRFLAPTPPLPFYVAGNALPDLLSLADRHSRLRPSNLAASPAATPEETALRSGALVHLATDAAFHKTAAFADAQFRVGLLVQDAGFLQIRVRRFFLAHVLVELALDAVLVRREASLADEFYEAFTKAMPLQTTAWTEATIGAPLPLLPGVLTRFAHFRYLLSYADDNGVAEGLNRVGIKARQAAFTGDNRGRLLWLVSQSIPVVADLALLLLEQTAALQPHAPTTEK